MKDLTTVLNEQFKMFFLRRFRNFPITVQWIELAHRDFTSAKTEGVTPGSLGRHMGAPRNLIHVVRTMNQSPKLVLEGVAWWSSGFTSVRSLPFTAMAQVQSLVRELRSHKHGQKKKLGLEIYSHHLDMPMVRLFVSDSLLKRNFISCN